MDCVCVYSVRPLQNIATVQRDTYMAWDANQYRKLATEQFQQQINKCAQGI